MNTRSKVVFFVIFFLVFVLFLRDPLIKAGVVIAARQVAGVEVTIDDLSMSLVRQSVHIKGLKAYNPQGFDREVMIDIPELDIDLDVWALVKGMLHFRYLRLDLKEVLVVKNDEGKTNINSLRFAGVGDRSEEGKKPAKDQPAAEAGKEAVNPMDIKIRMDLVSLNLGRVVVKEIRPEGGPSIRLINLNVENKEFKGINSAAELASLVMVEALVPVSIKHGFVKVKGLSAKVIGGLLEGVLK